LAAPNDAPLAMRSEGVMVSHSRDARCERAPRF
jgi:hypothetical protein